MTKNTPRRPAARYAAGASRGEQSSWSAKLLAVFMVVLLAVVIIAFAMFLRYRDQVEVTATHRDHERLDDHTLQVTLDIDRKHVDKPAYCIVTAKNYDMAEVGRRELIIPAGGEKISTYQVTIPTRDIAVAGDVYGCSTSMPSYMDY